MFIGTFFLGIVYLIATFILFALGKFLFDLTHRNFSVKEELVEKDNLALALAVGGYLFGLILAVGGALVGPSVSLTIDLIDIFLYGIIAVVLLNLSMWINGKAILYRFRSEDEIIRDQNSGVGMIEAANHIAMGLIIYGAVSGEGGDIRSVAVFWILGQITLIAVARVYNRMVPFDIHEEIEKDNVAVGTAFAGVLLATGNIVRFAAQGNFVSWGQNLGFFATVVLFGFLTLPLVRLATDRLILPGRRLTDELVHQERPNVGAGAIEGLIYVAMSFLIGWCVA